MYNYEKFLAGLALDIQRIASVACLRGVQRLIFIVNSKIALAFETELLN